MIFWNYGVSNVDETQKPKPLTTSEDTSGNSGTQGEIIDNVDSVKDSDGHGALASGADNPGSEDPDIPGRTSISSDDSTCSSLLSEEFYYFYQGEVVF